MASRAHRSQRLRPPAPALGVQPPRRPRADRRPRQRGVGARLRRPRHHGPRLALRCRRVLPGLPGQGHQADHRGRGLRGPPQHDRPRGQGRRAALPPRAAGHRTGPATRTSAASSPRPTSTATTTSRASTASSWPATARGSSACRPAWAARSPARSRWTTRERARRIAGEYARHPRPRPLLPGAPGPRPARAARAQPEAAATGSTETGLLARGHERPPLRPPRAVGGARRAALRRHRGRTSTRPTACASRPRSSTSRARRRWSVSSRSCREALTNSRAHRGDDGPAHALRRAAPAALPGARTATPSRRWLRAECERGLEQRYGTRHRGHLRQRLDYELGVIISMGYAAYFLIVADFTRFAREQGIATTCRGSAPGSIVTYTLGITPVDPILYELPFERFLNPDRVTMPDIDVDFEDARRDEVINYVTRKYGQDHVAQIITFGTMLARAAVRDVGRVMGYGYGEVDRIAKAIPMQLGIRLDEALQVAPPFREMVESDQGIHKLVDIARQLEGVARNASTHAAGRGHQPRPADGAHAAPAGHQLRRAHDAVRDARRGGPGPAQVRLPGPLQPDHPAPGGRPHRRSSAAGRASTSTTSRSTTRARSSCSRAARRPASSSSSRRACAATSASCGRPRSTTWPPWSRCSGRAPWTTSPPTSAASTARRQVTYLHPLLRAVPGEDLRDLRLPGGHHGRGHRAGRLHRAGGGHAGLRHPQEEVLGAAGAEGQVRAPGGRARRRRAGHRCRLQGLRALRALRLQQGPCHLLRPHRLPDRLPQGQLPGRVHDQRPLGLPRQHREGRRRHRRVPPPGHRGARRRTCATATSTSRSRATPSASGCWPSRTWGRGPSPRSSRHARQGGPFRSLADLCARVDLRLVNKRVLESLIKVDALDSLGHPAQLLLGLDDAMAYGQAQRSRPRDGPGLAVRHARQARTRCWSDRCPSATEASPRERLRWEKELLGPLSLGPSARRAGRRDGPLRRTPGRPTSGSRSTSSASSWAAWSSPSAASSRATASRWPWSRSRTSRATVDVVVFPRTYAETGPRLARGRRAARGRSRRPQGRRDRRAGRFGVDVGGRRGHGAGGASRRQVAAGDRGRRRPRRENGAAPVTIPVAAASVAVPVEPGDVPTETATIPRVSPLRGSQPQGTMTVVIGAPMGRRRAGSPASAPGSHDSPAGGLQAAPTPDGRVLDGRVGVRLEAPSPPMDPPDSASGAGLARVAGSRRRWRAAAPRRGRRAARPGGRQEHRAARGRARARSCTSASAPRRTSASWPPSRSCARSSGERPGVTPVGPARPRGPGPHTRDASRAGHRLRRRARRRGGPSTSAVSLRLELD